MRKKKALEKKKKRKIEVENSHVWFRCRCLTKIRDQILSAEYGY